MENSKKRAGDLIGMLKKTRNNMRNRTEIKKRHIPRLWNNRVFPRVGLCEALRNFKRVTEYALM